MLNKKQLKNLSNYNAANFLLKEIIKLKFRNKYCLTVAYKADMTLKEMLKKTCSIHGWYNRIVKRLICIHIHTCGHRRPCSIYPTGRWEGTLFISLVVKNSTI